MCDLSHYRAHGLLNVFGEATRFGGLPDSVFYALVTLAADRDDVDLTTEEKITAVVRLRTVPIDEFPAAVISTVIAVLDNIRSERSTA